MSESWSEWSSAPSGKPAAAWKNCVIGHGGGEKSADKTGRGINTSSRLSKMGRKSWPSGWMVSIGVCSIRRDA